jgi:ABC-type bacteriocin/lantibiotic exporter with double-glycine peptidase domain
MKLFFYSLAETIVTLMVSVALAFCFSFAFLSVQANLVFIVPFILFVRTYMLKASVVPMQDEIKKLKKDNEEKNKIIMKFVEDNSTE